MRAILLPIYISVRHSIGRETKILRLSSALQWHGAVETLSCYLSSQKCFHIIKCGALKWNAKAYKTKLSSNGDSNDSNNSTFSTQKQRIELKARGNQRKKKNSAPNENEERKVNFCLDSNSLCNGQLTVFAFKLAIIQMVRCVSKSCFLRRKQKNAKWNTIKPNKNATHMNSSKMFLINLTLSPCFPFSIFAIRLLCISGLSEKSRNSSNTIAKITSTKKNTHTRNNAKCKHKHWAINRFASAFGHAIITWIWHHFVCHSLRSFGSFAAKCVATVSTGYNAFQHPYRSANKFGSAQKTKNAFTFIFGRLFLFGAAVPLFFANAFVLINALVCISHWISFKPRCGTKSDRAYLWCIVSINRRRFLYFCWPLLSLSSNTFQFVVNNVANWFLLGFYCYAQIMTVISDDFYYGNQFEVYNL